MFAEYGDDSVAQLGGVHLACEGVSNVLTKVLEWGRLMAYLEQSTRYVPYTDRPGGRWKYYVPTELAGTPLQARYQATLDRTFEIYARWFEPMQEHFRARFPKDPADSDGVYRAAIRAKALDTLRGLLPAAVQSNMGLFGTGQAYEALLLRMRAQPSCRVSRVCRPDPHRAPKSDSGVPDARRSAGSRRALDAVFRRHQNGHRRHRRQPARRRRAANRGRRSTLTDFDPDGEIKVVAAALYAVSDLPDDQLFDIARRMSADDRAGVLRAYVGTRANRRHKPGTRVRADDLSLRRALGLRRVPRSAAASAADLEWQPLGALHGYVEPDAIEAAGAHKDWTDVMETSAELHDSLHAAGLSAVAPYAVSMAYRIRYYMEMNAREAMHLIELRTAPQGHPAYRRICQAMHTLIAEQAGHRLIADAMSYADHSEVELERLKAERAAEKKRLNRTSRLRDWRIADVAMSRICQSTLQSDQSQSPICQSSNSASVPVLGPVPRVLLQIRQRLERAHAIEEQHAVQMIGLVLDDARGKIVRRDVDLAAGAIHRVDPDRARARHAAADVRDAQAALPVFHDLRADRRDDRIDEHHRLVIGRQRVVVVRRDGGDEDAQALVNLRRRQPDAVVLVHGVDHVVDQLLHRRAASARRARSRGRARAARDGPCGQPSTAT